MTRPTYDELLQLYFDAQSGVIAERSGDIGGETRKLWQKCLSWSDIPDALRDDSGTVELEEFWLKQQQESP